MPVASIRPRHYNAFGGIATALIFAASMAIAVFNEDLFYRLIDLDQHGGGLFEHLTVLILLPAIVAGFYTVVAFRGRFPAWWLRWWVLGWTLACVYFAGEEASWGQWYFGWETPEPLAEVNRQQEMNLHNISSWLNYKPRLAVQIFIVAGGWLVPALLHLRGRLPGPGQWAAWVLAPRACWLAGALFLYMWIVSPLDLVPIDLVGKSEYREWWVAWFLALYLISYPVRLARLTPRGGAEAPVEKAEPTEDLATGTRAPMDEPPPGGEGGSGAVEATRRSPPARTGAGGTSRGTSR